MWTELPVDQPEQTISRVLTERAGNPGRVRPFVIGVAGGVAVGKSVLADRLSRQLKTAPGSPRVDVVSTDGFLLPMAELEKRDLVGRKGFPESYDLAGLRAFIGALHNGEPEVHAPIYSHETYDVVPGETQQIKGPDIVLIEGVQVATLVTSRQRAFDFSIYLDAPCEAVHSWYLERAKRIIKERMDNPRYPRWPFTMEETDALIERAWNEVNMVNLREHIRPSLGLVDLVVNKSSDHRVAAIRLSSTEEARP